jgi:uncharacterized protein
MTRLARKSREAKPRIVLDTNILISTLVFQSERMSRIRLAWQNGLFTPLVSHETAAELMRVLHYPKFKLTDTDRDELIADYLPYAEVIQIPKPPPSIPKCRDPFDLMFLHLATVARADALVTGDADLLTLHGEAKFSIITLDAFFATIEGNKSQKSVK